MLVTRAEPQYVSTYPYFLEDGVQSVTLNSRKSEAGPCGESFRKRRYEKEQMFRVLRKRHLGGHRKHGMFKTNTYCFAGIDYAGEHVTHWNSG